MKFSFPPIDNCVTGEAGKRSVLRNGRITRLPETIIRRQCGFAAITGTTISLFCHATICNRCVLVSRLRRKIANVARSRVAKRIRVQVLRESRSARDRVNSSRFATSTIAVKRSMPVRSFLLFHRRASRFTLPLFNARSRIARTRFAVTLKRFPCFRISSNTYLCFETKMFLLRWLECRADIGVPFVRKK